MLVLSRTRNEQIILSHPALSGRIVLTIVEIRNRAGFEPKVRIGFEAPSDVDIWRGELQQEIDQGSNR